MIIQEPLKAPSKSLVFQPNTHNKFPLLASPKYDGIRCLTNDTGEPISRTFKPIPNKFITSKLAELKLPSDLDGELITYDSTTGKMDNYNTVQSKIMSQDGEPLFKYHVFDYVASDKNKPYQERLMDMLHLLAGLHDSTNTEFLWPVSQTYCADLKDVERYELDSLAQGYEGVMLRNPLAPYKFGRATEREHIIYKLKRFADGEATIVGMTELMHNDNEQMRDEFGRAKRSSHADNQVGSGMMGALLVKDLISGVEFEIGTGFNQLQRKQMFARRADIIAGGHVIKYKHQSHGAKDRPRCPVFIGWRKTEID